MKAVILETRKNKAVALSDDGIVNEISNKNYIIGQTIVMERKIMTKMSKKYRNIAAGIAASLVILLGAGTTYAYNTPIAHISMDVNPSMTYSVNAFNRVIHVDRANPDAVAIFKTIEWDGENINHVIVNTILALKEKNYLENDRWYEDSIIIGVNANSTGKEQQLILAIKNELAKLVAKETDKKIDMTDFEEVVIGIGAQRVADAAKLSEELGFDVTPGKLNLVQKLDSSCVELGGAHLTSSETAACLKGSVNDIITQMNANRFEQKDMTPEGTDADLSENDSHNDGNDNNNINNSDDNEKANINTNHNSDLNNQESEMERERNKDTKQHSISHGEIDKEND